MRVRHGAGDVAAVFGRADWLGAALPDLIGLRLAADLDGVAAAPGPSGLFGRLDLPGGRFDASWFRTGPHLAIELEPADPDSGSVFLVMDQLERAAREFERATTLGSLCDRAASRFQALTGFDRVMVYRFLEDGSGRVLAETRRPGLHSFLNHHFPASDIPRQARELYVRNLVRIIPDVDYVPAPIVPAWTGAEPLDLSDSTLRSVSPVHLQYLRNMGVVASASVSIVKDGVLWGLIACHNERPRPMPYHVRAVGRTIAGSLAAQIKAKEEVESYRQRIRLRGFEDEIVRLLSREGTLNEALRNHMEDVLRIFDADGLAILRGTELATCGNIPRLPEIRALARWVLARGGSPVFATAHLEVGYPAAAAFRASVSGLLGMILSAEEPWLVLWFRAEQIEVVEWAGNPHKAGGTDPATELTPRASFAAWREVVTGHSRRWTLPETEAAGRLRSALLNVRQNRRIQELNERLTLILRDKEALLEQKDYLIGEVNHRVQNSLQLVSGFLSLQSRGAGLPEVKSALDEARRRLTAVALVHRRLYRGDQVQTVDASSYFHELCLDLVGSMGREWAALLTLDLAPVIVASDRAVTLGLVLTELVINVNKYAYEGLPGPIEVMLSAQHAHLMLIVADKGVGKTSDRSGFGSRMIAGLVTQLGGTLAIEDNAPGLRAVLTAPAAV